MKHIILFLLTVMASLAILPSCSDSQSEDVPGLPFSDNYHQGVQD